jgi:hypothetical protein
MSGVIMGALMLTMSGFVINPEFESLQDAARWSNTPESLVDDNIRGLGGGIEYAIASDFCEKIQPRFTLESPKPSCAQIESAIQSAFNRWAEGHPILKFVNVSDMIEPELPPEDHPRPWIGFGGEVDFIASTHLEYPKLGENAAFGSNWFTFLNPVGTNGDILPGSTLTAGDIVFETSRFCFHLDAQFQNQGCNHFESLVLHEIGHTLGLQHPNEFPRLNWDNDDDPNNNIEIDCQDPAKGLKQSTMIASNAIMNGSLGDVHSVRLTLANDDLGARDFLYPVCPQTSLQTD